VDSAVVVHRGRHDQDMPAPHRPALSLVREGVAVNVEARWRREVGRFGEELAVRHLRGCGYSVLDRNWRCREGELDIVARLGECLVFCEVKTRSGERFGAPVDAVGPDKARRLRRLACRWLGEKRPAYTEVRFDVISVWQSAPGTARIEHLQGAF